MLINGEKNEKRKTKKLPKLQTQLQQRNLYFKRRPNRKDRILFHVEPKMIDKKFYINVKELMIKSLPRPKLKPTVFVLDGEWLRLITVETEV